MQEGLHASALMCCTRYVQVCWGSKIEGQSLSQVGEAITVVRQRHLQQQYHFSCACPGCRRGACSEADARLVGLRCLACGGPVVPGSGCPAGLCSLQALPKELPGARRCFQVGLLAASLLSAPFPSL